MYAACMWWLYSKQYIVSMCDVCGVFYGGMVCMYGMFCCEHVVFFGKLPGDLLPERTLERTRDTWKGYLYNQSTDRDAALALVRLARSSLCFADLAFFSHLLLLLPCREKPGEELLVVFCLLLTASADSC